MRYLFVHVDPRGFVDKAHRPTGYGQNIRTVFTLKYSSLRPNDFRTLCFGRRGRDSANPIPDKSRDASSQRHNRPAALFIRPITPKVVYPSYAVVLRSFSVGLQLRSITRTIYSNIRCADASVPRIVGRKYEIRLVLRRSRSGP